jgi:hypothetical protein
MTLVIGKCRLVKRWAKRPVGSMADVISVRKVAGKITHVDLRFPDGTEEREVPIKCIQVPA